MFEVLAKGLGKNVDEATVKAWFFEEGDSVSEGDDLVELATEDSVITITAPQIQQAMLNWVDVLVFVNSEPAIVLMDFIQNIGTRSKRTNRDKENIFKI